jgi:dynein heavy chain
MSCAFADIDAEAIGVQVTQYLKVAVRAERGLPGNLVAPKLKGMVEEFKQLLPAVVDLRNKSLKPRHWEAIENIISHKFDAVCFCFCLHCC